AWTYRMGIASSATRTSLKRKRRDVGGFLHLRFRLVGVGCALRRTTLRRPLDRVAGEQQTPKAGPCEEDLEDQRVDGGDQERKRIYTGDVGDLNEWEKIVLAVAELIPAKSSGIVVQMTAAEDRDEAAGKSVAPVFDRNPDHGKGQYEWKSSATIEEPDEI